MAAAGERLGVPYRPPVSVIVLVEDDAAIAEPLARALRRDGHQVEVLGSGRDAVQRCGHPPVDLVILDLGLPDIDGVEVCRQIRSVDRRLPVLMLTARRQEIDIVVGLDSGADDYVTKPFRLAELLARVRSRLRTVDQSLLEIQDLRIEPTARRVWRRREEIDLTAKEFDLLVLLARHVGEVVPRRQIMRDVWEIDWDASTKTLDVHLTALRRKLGDDPTRPRYITTVRGVGLRLESG